ncbi:sulfotransferase [Mariniflexile gromovii]|uniref:Sulfotransferase n=1 Tax=Mariniflexile gromovii TaxID=362523 RepID=A0ABS4BVA7_9FLAO|nr:sulfotransferase [Mariniflexile gromovii]MBP0904514.1 sulfotransferase [Mariniflexile gromovii]
MMRLLSKKKVPKVTFIFGSPRGGTTFLWSLLESSKGVVPFIKDLSKNTEGKYKTSESGIYINDEKEASNKIIAFCKMYSNYRIIEKTPSHTLIYKKIIKDFPKSKNLVIFRHPLAIANSIINSEMDVFRGHTIDSAVQLIKDYYFNLIELSRLNNSIVITYENLLSNTQSVLNDVFKKLELDSSDLTTIVESNKGQSKIDVKGVFRKGEAFSFQYELDECLKEKLNEFLSAEICFYKSLTI